MDFSDFLSNSTSLYFYKRKIRFSEIKNSSYYPYLSYMISWQQTLELALHKSFSSNLQGTHVNSQAKCVCLRRVWFFTCETWKQYRWKRPNKACNDMVGLKIFTSSQTPSYWMKEMVDAGKDVEFSIYIYIYSVNFVFLPWTLSIWLNKRIL